MKTISVMVQLPIEALAKALAPDVASFLEEPSRGPDARLPTATEIIKQRGEPDFAAALKALIKATESLERAQFTRGEHLAAIRLFEAAKTLRAAAKRK